LQCRLALSLPNGPCSRAVLPLMPDQFRTGEGQPV